MPTNLAIDDRLLEQALKTGGHSTKRETVNEALREYIRRTTSEATDGGQGFFQDSIHYAIKVRIKLAYKVIPIRGMQRL